VFARPAPIVIETLVTGFIDMNRCDNLDQSNPAAASCRSPEPLADLVHLVLHPRLGVYLIDSGFAARFAESPPYGNYSIAMELFNRMLGVSQWDSVPIRAWPGSCAKRHLHPNAVFSRTSIRITPQAWRICRWTWTTSSPVRRMGFSLAWRWARIFRASSFEDARLHRRPTYAAAGPAVDLLGDGSLWAISTSGHTPDHTSYLVNGTPPTLLVGDASHFRMGNSSGTSRLAPGRAAIARALWKA